MLGPNGNQIASYTIVDSLLHSRQTQATAPDGNRTIVDTQYNANGLVAKKSTFYNAAVPSATTLVRHPQNVNSAVTTWRFDSRSSSTNTFTS